MKYFLINLQLFAEGGDGGTGGGEGASGEAGVASSVDVPSSVPARAKENYRKAMEKSGAVARNEPSNIQESAEHQKLTYEDLIKSDDYKAEHQKYMEKTIGERLKRYKGLEEQNGQMHEALSIVASKYGINPESENFMQELASKINEDNSYFENYAMEHGVTPDEARKIVTLERKVQMQEAQNREAQRQEQARRQIMALRQNAEKTKAQFPSFDLDTEMQDERFRRLCAANNGDTTASYIACHWNKIIPSAVTMASQQAQVQTANAVAANKSRPMENGLMNTASSISTQDFSKMSLKELREYASSQRKRV